MEDVYKERIEQLEMELEFQKKKYEIIKDYSNCALWEYEIASKRLILSRKLDGKWNQTNMVIEDYQNTMHKWGIVHPDYWDVFDLYCKSMDCGEEKFQYDVRQVADDAMFIWLRYIGMAVYDKNQKPVRVVGKTIDVTLEKEEHEKLRQKASRDSLTGLYNKEATRELIEKYLKHPLTATEGGTFVIADIDNFKQVNDTWGHLYGDLVLTQVANILTTSAFQHDIVGRIGGDEFVVFLKGKAEEKAVRTYAERLMFKAANTDMKHAEGISLSVGIAVCPKDAGDYEALYRGADIALYKAKHNGKNNYCFYEENLKYEVAVGETSRKQSRIESMGKAAKLFSKIGKSKIAVTSMLAKHRLRLNRKEKIELENRYMQYTLLGQNMVYYVVSPAEDLLVYAPQQTRKVFSGIKGKHHCYEALMGRKERCANCPLHHTGGQQKADGIEVYDEKNGCNYYVRIQPVPEGEQVLLSWLNLADYTKNTGITDVLTNVYKYEQFRVKAAERLADSAKTYALILFGIRNFNEVNESFGFETGDRILKSFALHVKPSLGDGELICRIKGDDFLVLRDESKEKAFEWANHTIITFKALMAEELKEVSLHLSASIYHIKDGDYYVNDICDRLLESKRSEIHKCEYLNREQEKQIHIYEL